MPGRTDMVIVGVAVSLDPGTADLAHHLASGPPARGVRVPLDRLDPAAGEDLLHEGDVAEAEDGE